MAEINYEKNINDLLKKQRQKGISKYGAVLEDNATLTSYQRIEHFEEELMDALMYAQHLKVVMCASLTANDFQRAAMRTASGMNYDNAGENGLLLNGLMGLNGESGECIDIMKKHIFQGHELDREHLIEELGDVAWYLAVCCEGIGVSLEEVMEKNIEKLRARYPEGFDKARSINRNGEKTYTFEEVKAELGLDAETKGKVHRKTYLEDFLEKGNLTAEEVVSNLCVKERYEFLPETWQWACDKNCRGCWNSVMPKEE